MDSSTSAGSSTFRFLKIFSLAYPSDLSIKLSLGQSGAASGLRIPDAAVKFFILYGSFCLLTSTRRLFIKPLATLWKWMKIVGNSNRYLKNNTTDLRHKDYAVIYGANNKGGISYSVFLAKKRMNLILIDKDWETIEAAEKTIKERLEKEGVDPRNMDIIKVQLSVFEEQNLTSTVEKLSKNGDIRFFINTKNVRLAKKSQKRF